MDQLKEMGEFVRSASSTIEAPVVRRLKEAFSTKAADQPAQGNQGHQGSRPRPAAGRAARRRGTWRRQAAARRWPGVGTRRRLRVPATTAPPLRPVPLRPPRARPTGRPTAPRSGRSRPTLPPLTRPRRHLTRRPGRCRRSRRRRPPSRPSRGRRTVPAPRGCPVRRAPRPPRPPRPTSAAPAGARGRAVPGPRRRVPARQVLVPASVPVVVRRAVRTRAVRVPGRPGPGRRDLVPPVRERPGPVPRVRVPAPRVPAPGRVTTRSARPRPAWVRRLRRGPRARPHRAGKAVPVLRPAVPAALAALAVPVRLAAAPVGPRVPACPMAARVPAGSRVRVPAAPGPAR